MAMTGFLAVVLMTLSAAGAPGGDAQPGLAWVFFNGSNFTRPGDSGVDPEINLDTGTAINDFSRVWLGRIAAPVHGEVAFAAEADNGCRVWIGDSLIIDGWAEDAPPPGSVLLRRGWDTLPHPRRVLPERRRGSYAPVLGMGRPGTRACSGGRVLAYGR